MTTSEQPEVSRAAERVCYRPSMQCSFEQFTYFENVNIVSIFSFPSTLRLTAIDTKEQRLERRWNRISVPLTMAVKWMWKWKSTSVFSEVEARAFLWSALPPTAPGTHLLMPDAPSSRPNSNKCCFIDPTLLSPLENLPSLIPGDSGWMGKSGTNCPHPQTGTELSLAHLVSHYLSQGWAQGGSCNSQAGRVRVSFCLQIASCEEGEGCPQPSFPPHGHNRANKKKETD